MNILQKIFKDHFEEMIYIQHPRDWKGYGVFFIVVMLATIPAFVMTWFVPFTYDDKPTTK